MPVWSMAKACHDGLAPTPGSAKALVRRIGTVLAWVSPAAFTTVPMTVSTLSASSWATAAAASGVAVMAGILQLPRALAGGGASGHLFCSSAGPWPWEGVRSVLAGDQLGDEPIDETVQSRPAGRAYDEL